MCGDTVALNKIIVPLKYHEASLLADQTSIGLECAWNKISYRLC